MTTYLDDRPQGPFGSLSRFLAFALCRHPRRRWAHRAPVLPADRRWRSVRDAVDPQSDGPRGHPVAAWPDLRPRRPGARDQCPDLRRQAPTGRPAAGAATGRRRAPRGPPGNGRRRDQRHHRRQPRLELRSRPDRGRRRRADRPAHLRGRVRAAGRRGRRRGPSPVHLRSADLADPRLHRPGVGRSAARNSRPRATSRTTSSARPGSRPNTRPSCAGPTGARASSATPRGGARRSSRRSANPCPGDSLNLTIDTKEQKYAAEGPPVGDEGGRPEARRRHRHEPADRRDRRAGQPADLRQQPVRARHQQRRLPGAGRRPRQAAAQSRDPGALPARLDVQARHRDRRAGRQEDQRRPPSSRPGPS